MNMYIISGKNVACLYCLNVEPELQEFQALSVKLPGMRPELKGMPAFWHHIWVSRLSDDPFWNLIVTLCLQDLVVASCPLGVRRADQIHKYQQTSQSWTDKQQWRLQRKWWPEASFRHSFMHARFAGAPSQGCKQISLQYQVSQKWLVIPIFVVID